MRKLLRFICCICFIFILFGCNKQSIRQKIEDRVVENCQKNDEKSFECEIRLIDFTNFIWDKFYYFNSGTSLDKIESTIGIPYHHWQDLSESLIFILKDSIVYHEEYELSNPEKVEQVYFYFNINERQNFFTPKNAIFHIKYTESKGTKFYELTPITVPVIFTEKIQ